MLCLGIITTHIAYRTPFTYPILCLRAGPVWHVRATHSSPLRPSHVRAAHSSPLQRPMFGRRMRRPYNRPMFGRRMRRPYNRLRRVVGAPHAEPAVIHANASPKNPPKPSRAVPSAPLPSGEQCAHSTGGGVRARSTDSLGPTERPSVSPFLARVAMMGTL